MGVGDLDLLINESRTAGHITPVRKFDLKLYVVQCLEPFEGRLVFNALGFLGFYYGEQVGVGLLDV